MNIMAWPGDLVSSYLIPRRAGGCTASPSLSMVCGHVFPYPMVLCSSDLRVECRCPLNPHEHVTDNRRRSWVGKILENPLVLCCVGCRWAGLAGLVLLFLVNSGLLHYLAIRAAAWEAAHGWRSVLYHWVYITRSLIEAICCLSGNMGTFPGSAHK